MRLVALIAVVALVVPVAASASSWPPPTGQTVQGIKIERMHVRQVETRSCMAHMQRVKVARWLAPVACEQPPRSQLLLASLYSG